MSCLAYTAQESRVFSFGAEQLIGRVQSNHWPYKSGYYKHGSGKGFNQISLELGTR